MMRNQVSEPTTFQMGKQWRNPGMSGAPAFGVTPGQKVTITRAKAVKVIKILRQSAHATTDHGDVWVLTRTERNAILGYLDALEDAL